MAEEQPGSGDSEKPKGGGKKRVRWGTLPVVQREEAPEVPRRSAEVRSNIPNFEKARLCEAMDGLRLEDSRTPPRRNGGRCGVLSPVREIESSWNWQSPDLSGLLQGVYPGLVSTLSRLTSFETRVSIPVAMRQDRYDRMSREERESADEPLSEEYRRAAREELDKLRRLMEE